MKNYKAIAAMALNRVIGRGSQIPWRLPEDLRWFKKLTGGQVVVMGRKTFESIGRPLPNRTNVVVSRAPRPIPGVIVLSNVEELTARAWPGEVFICGGAEIYRQLLPLCSDLYLTLIEREVEGDVFFPPFEDAFELGSVLAAGPDYSISHYRRKPPATAA